MPADDVSSSTRALDRAALDRVLARAAELQVASSDSTDQADELTEAQIVELGKEAGLSPQHLRQALAEERTRVAVPTSERGIQSAIFGAAHVRASRIIAGGADKTLSGLDAWMQREEGLQVKRHLGERIVWEARRDFAGNFLRAMNIGGRGYALMRAAEVAATVAAIDDSRVAITLEANLSGHRARMAGGAASTSAVAGAGSFALAVMGLMIPVAVIPVVVVPIISLVAARGAQQRAVVRAQLALEQILDRLERGGVQAAAPPSLLGALATAAANAAATIPRRR